MGFTLIELVMVLMIISVISVVVGKILLQSGRSFTTSNNITEVDWQGFAVLARMTEDIHNIRSKNDIATISATQLGFTNTSGTSVQYALSGSTLSRNSQTLATGVTAFSLGYLDSLGASTSIPSLVRYITITLSTTEGNVSTSFSTLIGTRGLT